MQDLLSKLEVYATEHHNGNFTIIKHKNNWYACYGIIRNEKFLDYIHSGETCEEVLKDLLEYPIDSRGYRDGQEYDFRSLQDVFAIKVNDKDWLKDYVYDKDEVIVFTTEKKAQKEIEHFKKIPKYADLNIKVVKVEEERFIHLGKGINRQTIREL